MLEINSNSFGNSKLVLIDGHEFRVRRPGAGEQLRMSQLNREFQRLQTKGEANLTEEEQDRVVEIATNIFNILAATFDDGGDGTKSRELIDKLDETGLQALMGQIFNEQPADAKTK